MAKVCACNPCRRAHSGPSERKAAVDAALRDSDALNVATLNNDIRPRRDVLEFNSLRRPYSERSLSTARPIPTRTRPCAGRLCRTGSRLRRGTLRSVPTVRRPLLATSPMLRMPIRPQRAYRSSSHPGHRPRVRRESSRALVRRVRDDARRHHWKWRQEVCAFPRQCGAAVEGSSECGSGPCRPALPGRCPGSGPMTPAPATRTASNSRAATAAVVMLVIAAVPGEGLGAKRIEGASPEIPASHAAAVDRIDSPCLAWNGALPALSCSSRGFV